MDGPLAGRCQGRFAVLQDLFQGLTFEDLRKLDDETILEAAPPKLRLLAAVFLFDLRREMSAQLELCPAIIVTPTGVLDGRGRVLSSVVEATTLDGVPVQHLHLSVPRDQLARVRVLDLSDNFLFAEDLPHILAQLEASFPACDEVRLANNRIQVYPEAAFDSLRRILGRGVLVDVTDNPFALTPAFDAFSPDELDRLVWVPRRWLGGQAWAALVPGRDHARIRSAHEAWYHDPSK